MATKDKFFKNRIGEILESNNYGKFEIVEFIDSKNIIVKFINTGTILKSSSAIISRGKLKDPSIHRLIFGQGINDADYVVRPTINGTRTWCPFYRTWVSMLTRCYSSKYQDKHPTYIGCKVCDEWLTFSNFKAWMETQNWNGKELDKDLLVEGNKVYSPETCVFIDILTNTFLIDCGTARGGWPIGVDFHKYAGKLRACCSNPFTGKKEHLGYFTCPDEAHQAWRKRKHQLACLLSELQTDARAASALRQRYAVNNIGQV